MRNLHLLLDQMQAEAPHTCDFYRECESLKNSVMYTPPESMLYMWQRAQGVISMHFDHINYPDLQDWERNIVNIWTDGKAKEQYEQSSR